MFAYPIKRVIKFGTLTATTGQTLTTPSGLDPSSVYTGAREMDVIINVTSLSGGTSPTITASIQELFSDIYVETGNSGSMNATGVTTITHDENGAANPNALLGKGLTKKVVSTIGGSPTGLSADVYLIFYN